MRPRSSESGTGFRPALGPNVHGFDEFWGFLSGGIDFYSHSWRDGTPDLYHNLLPVRHDGYLTDELTRRAVAFIEQHAQDPFFVEVAYNAVHWPFQPPGLPEGQRKREHWVEDGTREDYVKMLASADDGIGAILSALDRQDIAKHTLVIFTSDNGGEWLSRNAPLFHRKFTLWEGGIRVPGLLRWPGILPVGVTSKQVGMTMDLTATILDAAGVRLPATYHPDGVSLLPILAGKSEVMERTLFWRRAAGLGQKAVRKGSWKYMRDESHDFLFNLDEDVGERHDLASAKTKLLKELKSAHAAWEKDVDTDIVRTK
jgi:arylsulfatase A-like enzyme